MYFYANLSFSDPRLDKNSLRNMYATYCSTKTETPKTVFRKMVGTPFKHFENVQIVRFSNMKIILFKDDPIFSCIR